MTVSPYRNSVPDLSNSHSQTWPVLLTFTVHILAGVGDIAAVRLTCRQLLVDPAHFPALSADPPPGVRVHDRLRTKIPRTSGYPLMYSPTPPERPRKRRAINACVSCRSAKVRCDGQHPCRRCDRNDAHCQYLDAGSKDPNTTRIERLEAEMMRLRDQLKDTAVQQSTDPHSEISRSQPVRGIVQVGGLPDIQSQVGHSAVEKGLVTYDEAFTYFTRYIP